MIADNSPGSFRLLRLLLPLILDIKQEEIENTSEHKNKLKDAEIKIPINNIQESRTKQWPSLNLEKIAEIKAHLVS